MSKAFAVVLVLFSTVSTLSAQHYPISGVVQDSITSESLIGVNVILINDATQERKHYAVTDLEGYFEIKDVPPAHYTLSASYVGYMTYTKKIQVKDKAINLGKLQFVPDVQMMEGVVVQAKFAHAVQMGDTTQFSAGAYKTAPDASGQDLIEKLPGITVQDGKLQAQGEDVQQILVDGKPFFGGDVNVALQSLPAGVIASIQVFDKKSDKAELSGFDDGERLKTINIITKPESRRGQFGKATAGYGTNNSYQVGSSVNFFNNDRRVTVTALSNNINRVNYSADPNSQGDSRTQDGLINTNSIGINFGNNWGEKIDVSASYQLNHIENTNSRSIVRDYITSTDSGQVYTQNSEMSKRNFDHFFAMRLEYNIDSSNRILFRPNISLRHEKRNDFFTGRTMVGEDPLNSTENRSNAKYHDYDFNNNLYYSRKFRKKGRSLTFSQNVGFHTNEDNVYRLASNRYFQQTDSLELLNQYTHRDRTGLSWRTRLGYTEPLGEKSMMELEYSISNRINDSDKLSYNIVSGDIGEYNELDTTLSNTFESEYLTQELELGYQYANEKLRLQVEAEYQHASLKNDQEFPQPFAMRRSFNSVLPTVRFTYNFSKSNNLNIDYDTWTNEPSIGQLQNVIDNSNPLHLRTGNPDLDQSYTNRIRARYRANNPDTEQSFYLYLASSIRQNNIVNSLTIAEEPVVINDNIVLERGSQLSRPVNLDGYWDFHSYFSFGKPISTLGSNFNINGSVNHVKIPGMINDEINYVNTSNFRLGLSLSSNISENVDFHISTGSRYNMVQNSLRPALSTNFFNQTTRLRYNWVFWDGFVYRTELRHQVNSGLADDFDKSSLLVNMSIGRKFLKNDLAEISFNVYDLLEQNNNIWRNVSEMYIEDSRSTVLERYFMVTLTYNIRNFSRGASMSDFEEIQVN